ncbi:MAG TPA: hypothetical protein ENJ82_14455 [Bacteroidetes bacterium]|nr:hypothetical protein [Bacteroidota bacterium]
MIKLRFLFSTLLVLAFLMISNHSSAKIAPAGNYLSSTMMLEDGGKEKKRKSTANSRARQSAKDARKAMKMKESQVMGRAKVRLFFHNTFNTKYGKSVNFRSKRQRRRWKKGR